MMDNIGPPAPVGGNKGDRNPRIRIEIAPGELIDKLTILDIKRRKITVPEALANIEAEFALLDEARALHVDQSDGLDALTAQLRAINEDLWEIEDAIRMCEAEQRFDAQFVELARSVYQTNDRRAAVKRQINALLGARFREEKSYAG